MLFPFLSTKLDMSSEIEQHKVIHDSLATFITSIALAKADASKFDALKLQEALTSLKDPLVSTNIQQGKNVAHEQFDSSINT